MVPLTRGPQPEVLQRHAQAWTQELIEARHTNPAAKPQPRRYGHEAVREALRAMSMRKCFYCESAVAPRLGEEVDHYIESSTHPALAYDWPNLYLSCHACNNGKPPHEVISVRDCVDPCDPLHDPSQHLHFVKEQIVEVPRSSLGVKTIRKYRLDRLDLDLARSRYLNKLMDEFVAVSTEMRRAGATVPTELQRRRLEVFASPSRPFSAMMRAQVQRLLDALDGR